MKGRYIRVKVNGRRIAIDPGEILFLKAEGCYTRIYFKNNKDGICVSKPLCILKVLFTGYAFLQCHRSAFVNTHHINAFDSKKRFVRIEKHVIEVSKRKSTGVFQHLSALGIPDIDLTVCL